MSKTGKIFFSVSSLLFIGFMWVIIQTFKPVRNVGYDDVIEVTGKVVKVSESAGFDIIITLENDPHIYYINRGLQQGLTIKQLSTDLLNQTVVLYPIKRWTIFTRDGIMGHISKIVLNDRVIFNEIKGENR